MSFAHDDLMNLINEHVSVLSVVYGLSYLFEDFKIIVCTYDNSEDLFCLVFNQIENISLFDELLSKSFLQYEKISRSGQILLLLSRRQIFGAGQFEKYNNDS